MHIKTSAWLIGSLLLAACRGPVVYNRGSSDLSEAREATALSLAILGQQVPDFQLTSIDGTFVRLSDYIGQIVVLEWFNPECPFTEHAHTRGTLKDYPEAARAQGIVWIGIDSSSEEKMGGNPEIARASRDAWAIEFPILVDPLGEVGRRFDATTTPGVFLLDTKGVLVYAGAVDNMPFGKVPGGGEGQNYIKDAIEDLLADREVAVSHREPYGCRVKYAQPTLFR
ncbi:MAG: peroxiredoxin [Planctomycetota bacterium]|jgi:peroxiredoxin